MKFKKNWKRFWTLNRHHAEGFTLVELIVVIAILAILGGIAVPAYSGYVEKAERAADEQLLAAVNTAFAAACAINGEDHYNRDDKPTIVAGGESGKCITGINFDHSESFDAFFESETVEFQVIEISHLLYYADKGSFAEVSNAYANLLGIFGITDINAFNASIFAELGFDSLMGQVDMATQVALAADPDSTLGKMIYSEANMESLAAYLGYADDPEGFDAAFEALATQKVNQMIAAGADATDIDALYGQATNEILANTAVLVAATKSDFDADAFKTQLIAGNGKDTIKSSMNTDDSNQTALAQTAMAYAMYTSYVSRNGGTATNDIFEVLDTLESDGFKEYMGTAEATADMDGYLSAMNMIDSASGDTDAVSSLLVNGFNDPDLIALLNKEISG